MAEKWAHDLVGAIADTAKHFDAGGTVLQQATVVQGTPRPILRLLMDDLELNGDDLTFIGNQSYSAGQTVVVACCLRDQTFYVLGEAVQYDN
ncbi:hypothetical protein ACE1TF_11975 [Geomicrobium sp. JSM 1781026]|uniref:hypothetical protein n=1 Tax=Geomicrobium sp. JSM 1781026 TaxID=3344580 RepID=UPI0035BF38B6